MRKFEKYCKDYENIENYEKALKDNFKGWHCHHRLQTWTSDGERRLVNISAAELKALGMYYNRPADELIFLSESEHHSLHSKGKKSSVESNKKNSEAHKGKHHSEETRKKMSAAHKNISEEARKKMSDAHKGKKHSDEAKKKIGEAAKGMRWFNNGEKCIRAKECPDGFTPGRLLI